MTESQVKTMSSFTVFLVLGVWLIISIAIGASGILYQMPAPILGATNGILVTLTLLMVYFLTPLRNWVMKCSLRWFVLYHAVRFVGFGFLALNAIGTIPDEFAILAGWGDIAVATTALIVAFTSMPVINRRRWWIVLLWNIFGLLDILFVLRRGIGLGLTDPDQMVWITTFPWTLLPTFIVPLIIVTHILIFVRLLQTKG